MSESKIDYTLFDNAFEPVLVLNKKSEIIYHNHSLVTFSKSPPRVLKKISKLDELIESNKIPFVKLLAMSQKENKSIVSEEGVISFKNNPATHYTFVLKFYPSGENTIIFFNDLSVERNLFDKYKGQLEELKSTHSQIVQADKLATLGELTAGISHEINNPLTIASGNTEIIQMIIENDSVQEQQETLMTAITDVKDSLERIHLIVNNMRSFLHKSEDKKEYCSLAEVIQSAKELVIPSFNSHQVILESSMPSEDIIGLINKVKIEQVLINLCKNALDALVTERTPSPKVKITLHRNPSENFVYIDVSDNGPGIPEELHEDIFSPFFTTKEVGEGTGLGLSICSKIIESHQGVLTLKTKKGEGAQFSIKLPIIEVSSYSHSEYMQAQTSGTGKKILVIDNEVQILNILNTFLEEEGHTFIGSTNGHEALRFLNNMNIDLIITDYTMPKMNGSEFSKLVRENGITCPIYYLTSKKNIHHFNDDKDKYGVEGLILKPFSKDEIIKTIRLALGDKNE